MSKRNWKREKPYSITKALALTKQHGINEKNMSVERIADRLGENGDLLYKWIANGTMPVKKVIAFEEVCGINFLTQYLANSQGFLLVKAPSGRKAEHKDLAEFQLFMTEVAALIIRSMQGSCNAQEAIDAIKVLMEDLAFYQKNVAKMGLPQAELSLGDEHA